MFNVVLVHPEIPPNTGNVIRLCANTGAQLHLVEPLGFVLDDAKLRRAGLDYHEWAPVRVHASFEALLECARGSAGAGPAGSAPRMFALSTRGTATVFQTRFQAYDWLVFGSEGAGLSASVRAHFAPGEVLRLPMRPDNRSLNLSNAVAVTVFEAWRQIGFSGSQNP
ncbi:MAG: tRNA (cytidine(34)-2'-O)-methyltransferase [Burkholderiales bacterium]|jgi:tRNA (cytidine/uridine-2'-O-)-methyltransferase